MLELVVAALALAAASAAVMALRQVDHVPADVQDRRPGEGDLRPGDVLIHLDENHCVEGVVKFYDGDDLFVVVATLGEDGPFLVIEPGASPRCSRAEAVPSTVVDGTVPRMVVLEAGEFTLRRRAAVQAVPEGAHLCWKGTSCEAAVYVGPAEGLVLAFVGPTEQKVFLGRVITPESINWIAQTQMLPQGKKSKSPGK